MRIERIEIRNFKLLEDIRLEFSTDPARPLTLIRAENGSGKTSLLYAMLWGFYGRDGMPEYARDARLTSKAKPVGIPVDVSVMVEFGHDSGGGDGRYRLIRAVSETPQDDDGFTSTDVQLYLLTEQGEKPVEPADAFIAKMVPPNLSKVFFTNGDDVQDFMSGKVNKAERQGQVHNAIKSLLGLEQLYVARNDLKRVTDRVRKALSDGGSGELQEAAEQVAAASKAVETLDNEIAGLEQTLGRMRDAKSDWESELGKLQGIGDLDDLNREIKTLEADLAGLETQQATLFRTMRDNLKSESFSWDVAGSTLGAGLEVLSDLADRGVIPGTSIEVLRDRLSLKKCICGIDLLDGTEERANIEHLIEHQLEVSERDQRMTDALHVARVAHQQHQSRTADGDTFTKRRTDALDAATAIADTRTNKKAALDRAKGRRDQIDEERVQTLVEQIKEVEPKVTEADRDLARKGRDLEIAITRHKEASETYARLEREADLSAMKRARYDVAGDLAHLVDQMISTLESDHVERVQEQMGQMFLDIVGSDPELDSSVFGSVQINKDSFDIDVRTPQGNTLDFDAEINGASQRALTLSFIWSLMEVAGVEAPRTIDTPLGMVAGAVKKRMVEAITTPSASGVPFQLLLLLTRSEINDVESELLKAAGMSRTMTCSKDAGDLAHPWGQDRPYARLCTCDINTTCRICARTSDFEHGLAFRAEEADAR